VTNDVTFGSAKGWRAGIGGHLTNYTGTVAIPLNIELGFEQFIFRDFQVVGVRFAIGVGI
jgi:hypothetical protein